MVLSLERWIGKVAVVTGASSGIGAAISDALVQKGLIVVGVARRSELVQERAKRLSDQKGKLHAYKADVTQEEEVLKLFEWTTKNLGPVHVLVNNAGIFTTGRLTEAKSQEWKKIFDLNVIALCVATREAVKIMKENQINGHIIHINSVLGHRVLSPEMSVYPASKFAVTALTESLRQEFNHLGLKIKITSVSSGLVETEAITREQLSPEIKKSFAQMPKLKPEDIAEGVVYVLSTPERVQVHELTIAPDL